MELAIAKAIVHVLDPAGGAPVFSDRLLELEGETRDYLAGHLEKAYYNDAGKTCTFQAESTFPPLLLEEADFVQASKRIAQLFFDVMRQNAAIPAADLFVALCSIDGHESVAILKMNYKAAFAHFYQQVEGQHYNALIKQRTVLPPASTKPDESVIVDMTDGTVRLVEKKFELDGSKDFYISTRILHTTQTQPERAKLRAVQAAAAQAVKENYDDSKKTECEVATILCEEAAAGGGSLPVERVRRRIEEEFPLAAPAFAQELENTGLAPEERVEVPPARIRRMEFQSIKTESGIEMKIPTSLLAGENDYVEFINDPDGTISLLVKGIMI